MYPQVELIEKTITIYMIEQYLLLLGCQDTISSYQVYDKFPEVYKNCTDITTIRVMVDFILNKETRA